MTQLSELAQTLVDLQEAEVKRIVKEKLEGGEPAQAILAECRQGMSEVGKRFEEGIYFIPELLFAGSIMKQVMTELTPLLKEAQEAESAKTATVVIGTVRDDIHDIGKDIVTMMLQGTGFDVIDLGVNVAPEKFVETVQERNACIVGMSVFLTSCCRHVADTVEALKNAGLREKVNVMVGGAAASDMVAERTGCDFYGQTAVDATNHALAIARAG